MEKIDVLYIHPGRCAADYNIPVGLIGLMNSIDCSKTGKMYFEVTDDIILKSRIIVMDCHWYFSLPEIGRLSGVFKKINRNTIIVTGGHTASVFAEDIVNKFEVDYVIKGDAERPFPLLIKELLEGRSGCSVPNIVNKRFVTPQTYHLTEKDFSNCDYLNIDWFPLLKRRTQEVHKLMKFGYDEYLGVYPLIPIYKGCKYDCEFCYTRQTLHKRIYKRGFIARTPESIIKDLLFCSRHRYIRQVYIIADFLNIAGNNFSQRILSHKYNVNLYYEFEHFNTPLPVLVKMANCFNKCYFSFIFGEPFHKNLKIRFNYLSEVLAYFKNINKEILVRIYYGGSSKSIQYCEELQRQYKGLDLAPYEPWFRPVPFIYKNNSTRNNSFFSLWRKKAEKSSASHFLAKSYKDDEARFLLLLGQMFFYKGRYARTISCCKGALNLNPRKASACLYLAKAYFRLKRYEEAIKNAKKAIYGKIDMHFFLGVCYEKIKRYDNAIKEYRAAEKMNPNSPEINSSLFNCYKNINQKKQAVKEIEVYINKLDR